MSQLDHLYDRINDDLEVIHRVKTEESEVQKFYAGKTLLLTGTTGFMGKCLVEKLLRSCSDLKHIYIFLRGKRNLTASERLHQYFQNEIFQPLRKLNPVFEKKVTAINGDLALDDLGLSNEDRNIIRRETNIIIHNAANVKFNERIHILLKVNVLGTKNLLDLACECQNLETFMYVSTAFSHCYKLDIEERLFPPPGDLKMVYDMIDADTKTETPLSTEAIEMLIGNYPNTYTFSKAIAEDLIRKYSKNSTFACGIYRPSVVIPTAREPLIGWTDNINGTMPLFLGVGLGALHVFYWIDHPFDSVPCDMTINALLVVTSNLQNKWIIEREAVVYNYGSTTVNPISHPQMYTLMKNDIPGQYLFSKTVWWPFVILTSNYLLFMILHVLFHFFPACLLDVVLLLLRRKPRAVSLFIKATRNMDQILFLSNTNWKVHMNKTLKVIDQLNSVDKELFFCDLRQLDWKEYVVNKWKGMKVYILKESMQTINSKTAVYKNYLLWYLHYGIISVLFLTLMNFIASLIM